MDELRDIAAQMTGGLSDLPSDLDPFSGSAGLSLDHAFPDTPWTKEQDEVLREGILRYGPNAWDQIAQHMGNYGRTPQCCMDRWEKVKDAPVKVS
jgi:hypothetical protein